jgi:hypothetical protein
MPSTETIIRELKDRVDVLETMYAYCRHADQLNGDAMADLFVEDCASNFFAGRAENELHGREALRTFLRGALAVMHSTTPTTTSRSTSSTRSTSTT